jgi:hypothetical protein
MKNTENDLVYEIDFKNLGDKMDYSDTITILFFSNFFFIYLIFTIEELILQICLSILIIVLIGLINIKMWKIKCFEKIMYIQKNKFSKVKIPYYELKYNEIKSIKLDDENTLEIKFNWEKFNGDKIVKEVNLPNVSQIEYTKLKKIINSKK